MKDHFNDSCLNYVLKITNQLLKRFEPLYFANIRGKLHLFISNILTIGHKSGLKSKPEIKRYPSIESEANVADQFFVLISIYSSPNSLFSKSANELNLQRIVKKSNEKDTNLGIFADNLKYIFNIFSRVPVETKNTSVFDVTYLPFKEAFEKQLNDKYFREIFLTQTLIFLHYLTEESIKKEVNLKIFEIETLKQLYETTCRNLKRLNRMFYSHLNSFLEQEKVWSGMKDKGAMPDLSFEKWQIIEGPKKSTVSKGRIPLNSAVNNIFENIEDKQEGKLRNDFPVLGSMLERIYKDEDPEDDLSDSDKFSKSIVYM